VGIALSVVVVACGLTWLVGFSPVFAIDSVEASGTNQAWAADAVSAAAVPLGQPLIRLDTTAVADRVAALPWVATVHVVRHLSGTVEIAVTERTAVLALVQPGGYSLVDATGQAFDAVTELPAGLLPVTLSQPDDERLLTGAATVVAALPAAVRAQTTALDVTSADHFEFTLASGASLFWGSAEQSSLKAEAAAALLTVTASYYDVSAPAYPAARP
jgi:cell division protein FtsQ